MTRVIIGLMNEIRLHGAQNPIADEHLPIFAEGGSE